MKVSGELPDSAEGSYSGEFVGVAGYRDGKAFHCYPFFVKEDDDVFLWGCSGLARTHLKKYIEDEYREDGFIKPEGYPIVLPDNKSNYGAVWIGDQFLQKAKEANVPCPVERMNKSSHVHYHREEFGQIWVGLNSVMRCELKEWNTELARLVFTQAEGNEELSYLMRWTMARDELTRAAVWFSAKGEKKERWLSWYTKLDNDNGIPRESINLMLLFEALAEFYGGEKKLTSHDSRGSSELIDALGKDGLVAIKSDPSVMLSHYEIDGVLNIGFIHTLMGAITRYFIEDDGPWFEVEDSIWDFVRKCLESDSEVIYLNLMDLLYYAMQNEKIPASQLPCLHLGMRRIFDSGVFKDWECEEDDEFEDFKTIDGYLLVRVLKYLKNPL